MSDTGEGGTGLVVVGAPPGRSWNSAQELLAPAVLLRALPSDLRSVALVYRARRPTVAFSSRALRSSGIGEATRPGEFSINVAGEAKVLGSAQRIAAGAALFSTVVQVEMSQSVRRVIVDVSSALGYPLRKSSLAGLRDFDPALQVDQVLDGVRPPDFRSSSCENPSTSERAGVSC